MVIKYRQGKPSGPNSVLKMDCPYQKQPGPPIRIGSNMCQHCRHCSDYDHEAGTLNCALHQKTAATAPTKARFQWLGAQIASRECSIKFMEDELKALKKETANLQSWHDDIKELMCDICEGSGTVEEHLREDHVEEVVCAQCNGTGLKE